ncbi:MAG: histidinol-phosphatase [Firmicutes bacterium]|nr:histidinol-phosphatase [Bacillota bacterium]
MKTDFHIHTIPTKWDAPFEFSIEKLVEYVTLLEIDAIAITNHNCFDINQFKLIQTKLEGKAMVFPGIEVNVAPNNGHLLIIAEMDNLDSFSDGCKFIEQNVVNIHDSMDIMDIESAFGGFNNYLLIPHYDKSPAISKDVIEQLGDNIICGEVTSAKKYVRMKKSDKITPVIFSDCRISDSLNYNKTRQTYLTLGEISISALKLCLKDKSKVALSALMNDEKFQVTPSICIANGLNIVMGERSSGKTYFLNEISDANENVKYIKQFSLLENKSGQSFEDRIKSKKSSDIAEYFDEFSKVVRDIKGVSFTDNMESLGNYLDSLKKNAEESNMQDVYSKCKLFSEVSYTDDDLQRIQGLIKSTMNLLDSDTYRKIIDSVIPYERMVLLLEVLLNQFETEKELSIKKNWINSVINNIKQELQANTSSTMIEDIDFYQIAMDNKRIDAFNTISNKIKENSVILSEELGKFSLVAEKRPFDGAGEMKAYSGKVLKFSDAFLLYDKPYEFLQKLKEIDSLDESTYHEFFAKVNYKILNQYGLEVSGGEQSEFNLLNEITKARQYEILLIDEPESSFDNVFLKSDVNKMLKSISEEMPVVIVTHNSTVGASINADYLIYTRRDINNGKVVFRRFMGRPGDTFLVDDSGEKSQNIDALLSCFEAGDDAYQQRRNDYEILKNR